MKEDDKSGQIIPMVSIIIPTYNRAQFIAGAIESVFAQSYGDWEIIVVDDGSQDRTSEVLVPYAGRIEYVYQANQGVSAARNTGVRKAKGKWVAFLDSDDRWYTDKLKNQMEFLEESGVDVCFSGVEFETGKKEGQTYERAVYQEPFDLILREPVAVYIQAMIVRRSLLEKVGSFDERLEVAEDTDMIFRLAFEGKFGYLSEPMVYVNRKVERKGLIESLAGVRKKMCYAHIRIILNAYVRCTNKSERIVNRMRMMLGHFMSIMAVLCCREKMYWEGRFFAKEAMHFGGRFRTYRRSLIAYLFPQFAGRLRG